MQSYEILHSWFLLVVETEMAPNKILLAPGLDRMAPEFYIFFSSSPGFRILK